MKFKVGDIVGNAGGEKWWNGDEYRTITKCLKFNGESRYELSDSTLYWADYELKFYKEPQTETFDIEYIIHPGKPGIYKAVNEKSMLQKITKLDNGFLEFYMAEKDDGFAMKPLEDKFVFQEPKKAVVIYNVEHQVNGTLYSFISSQLLEEGQFVISETKHCGSYGKIVYLDFRELTETEIKQYKECWRV